MHFDTSFSSNYLHFRSLPAPLSFLSRFSFCWKDIDTGLGTRKNLDGFMDSDSIPPLHYYLLDTCTSLYYIDTSSPEAVCSLHVVPLKWELWNTISFLAYCSYVLSLLAL